MTNPGDGFDPVCVVLTSIGEADAPVTERLAARLGVSRNRARRVLWRTPVQVARDLSPFEGHRLVRDLAAMGLECCMVAQEEAPEQPRLWNAAVCPRSRPGGTRLLPLLMRFPGIDRARLREGLLRGPGWVLRRISPGTISVLRRRFAGADVAVRVSDPETARYDLVAEGLSPSQLVDLRRVLAARAGTSNLSEPVNADVAVHLRRQFAEQGLQLLDRAFQNYCIVLTTCPDTDAGRQALVALAGLSPDQIERMRYKLPVLLDGGLDRDEAHEARAAYASAGLSVQALSAVEAERLFRCAPGGRFA